VLIRGLGGRKGGRGLVEVGNLRERREFVWDES